MSENTTRTAGNGNHRTLNRVLNIVLVLVTALAIVGVLHRTVGDTGTTTKTTVTDTSVSAPTNELGQTAEDVEKACARVVVNGPGTTRSEKSPSCYPSSPSYWGTNSPDYYKNR